MTAGLGRPPHKCGQQMWDPDPSGSSQPRAAVPHLQLQGFVRDSERRATTVIARRSRSNPLRASAFVAYGGVGQGKLREAISCLCRQIASSLRLLAMTLAFTGQSVPTRGDCERTERDATPYQLVPQRSLIAISLSGLRCFGLALSAG
jgi:hypothetical protein